MRASPAAPSLKPRATSRKATSRHPPAAPRLPDAYIGLEARSVLADHLDVRVWLRLLACSAQIEHAIRARLRQHFGTTLPRFDYLAQLERHPDGLRMSALSSYMMVTGGNVTGLTDQLVADGWVQREADTDDGRAWRVRLTPKGRREFAAMAAQHEGWLAELLHGFALSDKALLFEQLGRLRLHLAQNREPNHAVTRTVKHPLPRTPNRKPRSPA
jgi:DNA-binding MarR family transcriptional regulator